jgi:hypothetical protein
MLSNPTDLTKFFFCVYSAIILRTLLSKGVLLFILKIEDFIYYYLFNLFEDLATYE